MRLQGLSGPGNPLSCRPTRLHSHSWIVSELMTKDCTYCYISFSRNNRFVLKPGVAIASEVSISSKNFLAITDLLARNAASQLLRKPPFIANPLPAIRDSQSLFHFLFFVDLQPSQTPGPRGHNAPRFARCWDARCQHLEGKELGP